MTTDAQTIDLRPKRVNLLLYQGDSTSFTVTFDVAISTTGSSARMMIKNQDGSTALTLAIGSGISLAGQVFTVSITKTQMAALPTDRVMNYDFQWTNAASAEFTVVAGTITVDKQKTTG